MRWTRNIAICLLALPLSACIVGRQYIGSELPVPPEEVIVPGVTTMGEVLRALGAPDRIQRRRDGEVFIYRYVRKNSSGVRITEPVVTRITFFRYDKRQQKSDRVVVLFDRERRGIDFGHTDGRQGLGAH